MQRALVLCFAVLLIATSTPSLAWVSVCGTKGEVPYCRDVGKRAYNFGAHPAISDIDLGPIIGVAWRPKGSIVSTPGYPVRVSPRDAYYYIIGPFDDVGGVSPESFVRQAREIEPRLAKSAAK